MPKPSETLKIYKNIFENTLLFIEQVQVPGDKVLETAHLVNQINMVNQKLTETITDLGSKEACDAEGK